MAGGAIATEESGCGRIKVRWVRAMNFTASALPTPHGMSYAPLSNEDDFEVQVEEGDHRGLAPQLASVGSFAPSVMVDFGPMADDKADEEDAADAPIDFDEGPKVPLKTQIVDFFNKTVNWMKNHPFKTLLILLVLAGVVVLVVEFFRGVFTPLLIKILAGVHKMGPGV